MAHPTRSVRAIIYSDGASSGNPGPAGIGAVVTVGEKQYEISRSIGIATNNMAEYQAIISALEIAKREGADGVEIYLDSELVVKQLKGEYRVKNEGLKPLYSRATSLLGSFKHVSISHIPREENTKADALAKSAVQKSA
ncbi:MAG: reverse transcriptase-like protein [Nitrospirae bacterium]|nr:MAG: reverse transcriptase-like protein [Nitrospirota bacterium]